MRETLVLAGFMLLARAMEVLLWIRAAFALWRDESPVLVCALLGAAAFAALVGACVLEQLYGRRR